MTGMLLTLLIILAVLALSVRRLLSAIILLAVFSLLSSLLFYYLNAPDVAITEAAVGAGVSTLIFVWLIHKTERRDET